MGETCAVCKKGQGPEKCEVCGFSDNGFINRQFPIPEDAKNWIETVVKPYRLQWEAKQREAELLAQLEASKKREAELLAQVEALRSSTFTDPRDGYVYKTVKIGNQVWMAENLAYNAEGSKCYEKKYGRLYDWETAMKVSPPNWHLPSVEEWQVLVNFAGGQNVAGKKLKAKSSRDKDGNGTDDFGFAALLGGYRFSGGDFYSLGDQSIWWTASEKNADTACGWGILSNKLTCRYFNDKFVMYNVRCLQNQTRCKFCQKIIS